MISKDTLWKGIIEDLAEDFLQFFFPEYVHQMDFSKGFTFLDKELDDFLPAKENRNRRADKLFKVYLKDGEESWFLVHVEFQGYYDPEFPKRMFQMCYRIEEKYHKPLTAVVLYTDTNRSGHFKQYHQSFMGTELIYRFNTFVLMDNPPDILIKLENIFARALEAAWQGLENPQREGFDLLESKLNLIRPLLNKGYPRDKIRKLIDFVKYYKAFQSQKLTNLLEKELDLIYQNRQPMGITEAILHEVSEQAREKAYKEAWQEAWQEASVKVKRERDYELIKNAVQEGLSASLLSRITGLSEEEIKELIDRQHLENS